jgi:hypothetical protein
VARNDFRKGALPFEFLPIPKDVLRSPAYQALPFSARALMLDLMAQYTGKNNGRLSPAFQAMQRIGWTKHTLIAAKRALLKCPFVVLTRRGHAPKTAEWIGLTWWKLDFHPSMNIQPREFPYLNFREEVRRADPNTGRDAAKKVSSEVQKLHRYPEKTALRGAETAPIGARI